MNKLQIPNPSRGIDFGWEVFEFLFGTTTIKGGIYEIMTSMLRTYGDNFIVYGCTVVGSAVSAGLIMLDGELLYVDAHTKTNDYFAKVTTNDTTWTVRDLDGNQQYIFKKNRATLSGASGSLIYSGNTLKEMILPKAGYSVAHIEIGDWDMDANATKDVTHGLTLAQVQGIVSIQAIIRDDSGANFYPFSNYATNSIIDGVQYISSTVVRLSRINGVGFDGVNFNQTSFNRGWLNILYAV